MSNQSDTADGLPLALRLAGRRVVAFGARPGAAAKLALLDDTGAEIAIHDDAPACAELAGRVILPLHPLPDLAGTRLVVIAPEIDDATAALIAEAAAAAGALVHAVDRPALSDVTLPALVRRGPLQIAIHTGGRFPALASVLRQRLEALLPAGLGAAVTAAGNRRAEIARRLTDQAARRRFWRDLAARLLDHPEIPIDDLPADAIPVQAGRVDLVGAGPGGPGLLTRDAARAIEAADVVLYDALIDPAILELARREARRIPVGKRCGAHAMRQATISALMVRLAGEGLHVVRLKGGDPAIFGRLDEELGALDAAGIPARIIPGVTAAAAAAAHLCRPLTLRGAARSVSLVAGHDLAGGLPGAIDRLAAADGTLAIYMGRDRASAIVAALIAAGRDPAEPAAAVEWAGRPQARSVSVPLAMLPDALVGLDADGPVTILVGEAIAVSATAARPAAAEGRDAA
ncbi:uroporphyrinogen-III C-methyltransferase [Tistrella sp.]|uniref:Uroporphyrinogen-III C-methyltransferase n=1 Tax=Tistrella mobilis TaxID=171437 RepID=A0A3B9IGL3_9PROT|nr:uroporphyrinogen-III C-methyltransferase [Tistrella sp.]MAD35301.1 uroporphyrinogen-III C-methyltransferase [Tistrella sp.]HAE46876.1 uroporphyrinogen-III C-methyltransferase [Tistrella mobilis]